MFGSALFSGFYIDEHQNRVKHYDPSNFWGLNDGPLHLLDQSPVSVVVSQQIYIYIHPLEQTRTHSYKFENMYL
jgi:hypothetical protein